MTPAIMLSFVIPALVAVTLTVLLIKEKDYFFNNKSRIRSRTNRQHLNHHHYKNKSENHKNDQRFIDFSGGMMGL